MNQKLTRGLKVFAKTVEAGSMSKAADLLHMTTSAVSQQISKLEQDIGLSLFNRNTRNLTLTEAGSIYYKSAIQILQTAKQAEHELELLQHTPSGILKISAPIGFGGGLLSKPLRYLSEQFPQIKVDLILTDEPIDIITEGVDLAICIGPLQDSNLIARHLADWQLIPCVSCHHPLAQLNISHPESLAPHALIGHSSSKQNPYHLSNQQTHQQVALPTARFMVNNMQACIQLTLDGIGYGVLPEPEIRHHLSSGRLKRLCAEWSLREYSVYAVTPHRDTVAAKTTAAIESLKEWFTQVSNDNQVFVGDFSFI
ncbi:MULTISPECIES: LysR family transcriptional regulator [Pseudoalteromonas]|uniref:LysR family transcriptional regulator n=1 Tax=Pseudoalteromonas TaxID=53246 RepID=UPI001109F12B|nr:MULTISPECIES: LysR family transcriptional regulator [Pseudoalteromonas]MCG9759390.1 LysR family transcriptional regulator [Pseudoalteromonas sp. Isolate6]NKC20954.1 LysR family transcriptional regulator [Pseudoalteromonas galatheae]